MIAAYFCVHDLQNCCSLSWTQLNVLIYNSGCYKPLSIFFLRQLYKDKFRQQKKIFGRVIKV